MTQTATTPISEQAKATDSSDVIIKCLGLTKIFRDFWMRNRVSAVKGIDLEVRRGEVFGLLGPNGSGKSTTIKMILGLLHPTAGRIAVFGRPPRDVAIKKQIGYLPEETYLYRFLNARETLEYYGRLFHQNRRQRQKRIDMLLEMVGLDRVGTRPIGEYSKGMQRRIGLAQALINDPQLLILDEPTTGMDPIGTRQIKDLILELSRRGKTILLCSHLLADVEDVCDRVAIMFGGKVRRYGTVGDLLVQEGMTTLHTPELNVDDIQAVEQLLEQRGKHIDRVEQPRQKLESLFLQIVHEAQSEGAQTSGAHAGGRIAEFLTAETESAHLPEDVQAEAIIDQLVAPKTDGEAKPAAQAEAAATPGEPIAGAGRESQVIDDLIQTQPTPPPTAAKPTSASDGRKPGEAAGETSKPKQDEQVDMSVLDSLMGSDDESSQEQRKQQ